MAKENKNNDLVSITRWKQFKIWKIYSGKRTQTHTHAHTHRERDILRDKKLEDMWKIVYQKQLISISLANPHINFKVLLRSAPLCSWMALHSNFRQFKCAFTLYFVHFFQSMFLLWCSRYDTTATPTIKLYSVRVYLLDWISFAKNMRVIFVLRINCNICIQTYISECARVCVCARWANPTIKSQKIYKWRLYMSTH